MQKIQGTVSRIYMKNEKNHYSVMQFRNESDGKIISVVGHFPIIHPFLKLTLFGEWKSHQKYGKQFSVTGYDILEPNTNRDLVTFLSSDIIGCSYATASLIAKEFGCSYLEHYSNIPLLFSKLSHSASLEKTLKQNASKLNHFYYRKDMLSFLSNMGFDQIAASKIAFSDFPPSKEAIKKNPYDLIIPFDLTWQSVDQIALKNGMDKTSKTRIEEGILFLLEEASSSDAHMYLPLETIDKKAKSFLGIHFDVHAFLSIMESDKTIVCDLKNRIYSATNFQLERSLAFNLYRIAKCSPIIPQTTIKINTADYPYSTDQVDAIELALNNQLSIISGPAGTGKTTIVLKMIKELKKIGYKIQLCAPTGRAAKRMSEVTNLSAKTIHHLLAFHPETKLPVFNKQNPLRATCYIIDEASMLDIKLASYLMEAISNGSKVIIIGDEDQLPSIGPGTVLKDLLTCGYFPMKKLNQVFRQEKGSYLLDTMTNIRNGQSLDFTSYPAICDFKLFRLTNPMLMQEAIKKLVTKFKLSGKYDIFNDLQIISPIHNGPIGVKVLNTIVQNILNPNPKEEIVFGSKILRTGDKITQTHNNYDKKLFNGDVGKITSINKREKSLMVNFYGKDYEYIGDDLFEIELAYVTTVHKVQGGEFPFVIMPFHTSFGRMINRKLLYTAGTRAKTQFLLLSDEETIEKAIQNNDNDVRYCNLTGRLKEARLKLLFT